MLQNLNLEMAVYCGEDVKEHWFGYFFIHSVGDWTRALSKVSQSSMSEGCLQVLDALNGWVGSIFVLFCRQVFAMTPGSGTHDPTASALPKLQVCPARTGQMFKGGLLKQLHCEPFLSVTRCYQLRKYLHKCNYVQWLFCCCCKSN